MVGFISNINSAVDGDVVVVPEYDEVGEFLHACKADGLLRDAFHQAAVASNHVSEVVNDGFAVTCTLYFFGDCETDRVPDALAKRACRRFNTAGMAVFWMTSCFGAPLTEIFDLLKSDVFVARQIHQGVQQHGTVTCGQDEPVAVSPIRCLWIKVQMLFV